MKKPLFTIIVALLPAISPCQNTEQEKQDEEALWLRIRTISFIKNNEYFNPITEGYTLIGSFIRPEIIYSPGGRFEIGLGLHQQLYSGNPRGSSPSILFSARWKVSGRSTITLGALDGCDRHRMYDPHFDSERLYSWYTENGASFVTESDHFFSDTWINWENFIFWGDTVREVFTAGESFSYTLKPAGDFLTVNLPLQLKFKHFGGQISNYSEHVVTFFNLSAGAGFEFNFAEGRYGTPGIEYLRFVFRELTQKGEMGITSGNASWIRFHYRYRWLALGSWFWFSHNFFAPDGNQIYSSVSDYKTGVIIPDRKIWTSSYYVTLRPAGLFEMLLGFEGYYDMNLKRMDSAAAFHLRFDRLIRVATLKSRQ